MPPDLLLVSGLEVVMPSESGRVVRPKIVLGPGRSGRIRPLLPHALAGWGRLRRRLRWRREIHLGCLPRCFRCYEVGVIWFETRPTGKDVLRELLNVGVVILQCIVVALALDGNAVLGPGEFVLQTQEILI